MSYTDRPLNAFENLNYVRNKQHGYPCFVVGAKLRAPPSKPQVAKALERLVTERVVLRSNVFNGVVKEIKVNVEASIEINDGEELTDVLNQLLSTEFQTDVELPLWKVTINNSWLLIQYEHTLVDGNTGAFFVEDLITLLQGSEIQPDVFADAVPLYKASYWDLIKHVKSSFFQKPPQFKGFKNTDDFETLKKIIQLNRDQFDQIRAITRREHVSFTNFLSYIQAKALKTRVQVTVPVNLRRFLDVGSERAYGLAVSGITFDIAPYDREIIWDEVRDLHRQLSTEEVQKSGRKVGLLEFVDGRKVYADKLSSNSHPAVEISNLGLRNLEGVDEFIFSQPNHTGAYFTNDVISSSDVTNITVSGPFESEGIFEDYVNALQEELLKFVN